MKAYANKVGKTLLLGLIILVVAGLIYMVVPKYQIQSVRVDGDTVVVTRINTITGEVTINSQTLIKSAFDKYGVGKKYTF